MDLDDVTVGTAQDAVRTSVGSEPAPHDHAWRRVRVVEHDDPMRLGEYRCDLCEKTWSL